MEALFELLSKIGGTGWIVAAIFGYGYWKERTSRDKLVMEFIDMQRSTNEALNGNTTAFNAHTVAVNSFKEVVSRMIQ